MSEQLSGLDHLLGKASASGFQLRDDFDDPGFLFGAAVIPRLCNIGIVSPAQSGKPATVGAAVSAVAGKRIDPEEVVLEPYLLLSCAPRESTPTSLAGKIRIDVLMARADTEILFGLIPTSRRVEVDGSGTPEKEFWHLSGICISEDIHG